MEVDGAGTATFPNGLVLKLTPGDIAKQVIWEAAAKHTDPPVPTVKVTRNGEDVYEPNPDDPDYHLGLERAKARRAWAAVKATIMMGAELVTAPPGVSRPEAINWRKIAAARDVPVPVDEYEQFEFWLRYYGFPAGYSNDDAGKAMDEYLALCRYLAGAAGITMEVPTATVATFPDNAGRGADPAGDAVAATGDGDGGGPGAAASLGY